MRHPKIIQGGMGTGVSNWRLARSVSQLGQLGVVSGTALDVILARRLQNGDRDGAMRRAFGHFPIPGVAQRVWDRFFIPGGKGAQQSYKTIPLLTDQLGRAQVELLLLANFVEVFLAKEGHGGLVGINFLHKIQFPLLPSLYGAMLAGVDYVLIGAGIPMAIPGILDQLARGESVSLKLEIEEGIPGEDFHSVFDPQEYVGQPVPVLQRPFFLAIISSYVLALALARKATGHVDGFVVEGATAGGHNAPPRGALRLNERGEPIYGPRDMPEVEKIAGLGRPFWLAGSFATPERLTEALAGGAAGVQVGTAFAFCDESGIEPELKSKVLHGVLDGTLEVFTDPLASPTGFPFKVVSLEGTIAEAETYAARERVCDLGYLRRAYRKGENALGFRCPGEPEVRFVEKGGVAEETCGRKCICNGLLATIGLGQIHSDGYREPALITAGDDLTGLKRYLSEAEDHYSAEQVVHHLLGVDRLLDSAGTLRESSAETSLPVAI